MNSSFVLIGLGLVCAVILAPNVERKDVDALPAIKELPDPFVFADGTRVHTKKDWARRREELKAAVLAYEYGELPPKSAVKAAEGLSTDLQSIGASEKEVNLSTGPGGQIKVRLILTIPKSEGPHAAILKGDLCWSRVPAAAIEDAARRGYVVVEFDRTQFAPDSKERGGVYAAYPDYNGGRLSAWAWGYHRVIDYLVTQPFIDKKRIAVTGHSRGGKATLVAGATDERIALTAPNNSGCGGAGCYRFQAAKSEDIAAITKNFPFWFDPRFTEFIGKVDRLPVDQHSVKALVAPRALLTTEALGDEWANPEGSQQTYLAAREVYRYLGAENKIGIHFRPGVHEQNVDDWHTLLDFADRVFFGKTCATAFDQLSFRESARSFAWSAPK